jgi:MFS family permease
MILSIVLKFLKNFTVPAAAVLMGIGYGFLGSAGAFWMVIVAVVFIGLGCGLMSPPVMLQVPKIVSPDARAFATAVVSSFLLFGQFLSPYFMNAVVFIGGQDTFRFRFNFLAVFLIVAAVIGTIGIMMKAKAKTKTVST